MKNFIGKIWKDTDLFNQNLSKEAIKNIKFS